MAENIRPNLYHGQQPNDHAPHQEKPEEAPVAPDTNSQEVDETQSQPIEPVVDQCRHQDDIQDLYQRMQANHPVEPVEGSLAVVWQRRQRGFGEVYQTVADDKQAGNAVQQPHPHSGLVVKGPQVAVPVPRPEFRKLFLVS